MRPLSSLPPESPIQHVGSPHVVFGLRGGARPVEISRTPQKKQNVYLNGTDQDEEDERPAR